MSEIDRAIRELERAINRALRNFNEALREIGRIVNRTSVAVMGVIVSLIVWTGAEYAVNAAFPNLAPLASVVFLGIALYYIWVEIDATLTAKTAASFVVALTVLLVDMWLNFGLKLH